MTTEELKALPIEPRISLHNASYKNPGRLLVRADMRLGDWKVYFGVNGKAWYIGNMRNSTKVDKNGNPEQESAIVFGGTPWRRVPWNGKGEEPAGGPNVNLALMSKGAAGYEEVRFTDKVMVCVVHPTGQSRSMCYYFLNDVYDTTRDSGYGTPKKTRRSVPRAEDRRIWPDDWTTEEPKPTMDFTTPPDEGVRIVHPGTKTVLTWPIVTSKLPNVVRVDKGKRRFMAFWPRLSENEFPYVTRNGDPEYMGVLWMVLPNYKDDVWIAAPTEQLHQERERQETFWMYEHILDDGQYVPRDGDVFGLFIAGPSRHEADRPEYRRRTGISWWVMKDGLLSRYQGEAPPPPPPVDNKEIIEKALARTIADEKELLRLLDSNKAMQELLAQAK